ncbi:MAG: ATP-NAD/AcoX kinase [Microgenomates group bacterium Gr01-1014_7]|nr:MAG: ATP-NAD/AcoX kinase [Microgenomates group bacterium Gr01-1014_7]
MKVLTFGKASKNIDPLVKELGFEIVTSNPEVIISFGGDGTLLSAERQYPGIPKLPLRNSQICNKCASHEDETVLKKLLDGRLQLKEYKKLETIVLYKNFYALNDFVVRNSDPTHTIRFLANDKYFIGDGIVVASIFGSTGYFKSITGKKFEAGFGIAFNNTTEKVPPVFLGDKDTVTFNLKRGKATLSFDNSRDIFNIDEGSELIFKLSDQTAKIYEPATLRCPNCKIIKG